MNAPPDPSDPLFESLAEEAADLPARAATAARQRQARSRQNRQQLVRVAVFILLGVSTWQFIQRNGVPPRKAAEDHFVAADQPTPPPIKHAPGSDASPFAPIPSKTVSPQPGMVNVAAPLPLPTGLNEEQTEFVKALPDVPLLFIRDDSNKVIRIHLVER